MIKGSNIVTVAAAVISSAEGLLATEFCNCQIEYSGLHLIPTVVSIRGDNSPCVCIPKHPDAVKETLSAGKKARRLVATCPMSIFP